MVGKHIYSVCIRTITSLKTALMKLNYLSNRKVVITGADVSGLSCHMCSAVNVTGTLWESF